MCAAPAKTKRTSTSVENNFTREAPLTSKRIKENKELVNTQDSSAEEREALSQNSGKNSNDQTELLKIDPYASSTFKFRPGNHVVCRDPNHLLVGLEEGERLCFVGGTYITPVVGSVSVMGYTMGAAISSWETFATDDFILEELQLRTFPCFSPRTHSILAIESVKAKEDQQNKLQNDTIGEVEKRMIPISVHSAGYNIKGCDFKSGGKVVRGEDGNNLKTWITKDKLSQLVGEKFTSVLLLSNLATPSGMLGFRFAMGKDNHDIFRVRECEPRFKGFYPVVKPTPGLLGFYPPSEWTRVADEILHEALAYHEFSSDSWPVVVVCGTKNSGKSTLTKYLCNRLLSEGLEEVAYINCDVGQSEFTPPGMLSLHYLSEPVLGPTFTQLRSPAHASYLGATYIKLNHADFINHIQVLVSLASSRRKRVPIIINTSGWIRGMGGSLLEKLIDTINPTHILSLGPSRNANTICLPPFSPKFTTPFSTSAAEDHRILTLSSYFALTKSGWNFDKTLAEQPPYAVPWANLELWSLEQGLDLSQVLYAFNGALVGLCASDSPPPKGNDGKPNLVHHSFASSPPPSSYSCLGLGLIRGIDVSRRLLLIVTPVDPSQLYRVAALFKGSMGLPLQAYLQSFPRNTAIPYISY